MGNGWWLGGEGVGENSSIGPTGVDDGLRTLI